MWQFTLSFHFIWHYIIAVIIKLDYVLLKLDHGVLQYAVSSHVISLSSTIVSDGKWHCVQVRWTSTELVIDVDYGLAQVCLI